MHGVRLAHEHEVNWQFSVYHWRSAVRKYLATLPTPRWRNVAAACALEVIEPWWIEWCHREHAAGVRVQQIPLWQFPRTIFDAKLILRPEAIYWRAHEYVLDVRSQLLLWEPGTGITGALAVVWACESQLWGRPVSCVLRCEEAAAYWAKPDRGAFARLWWRRVCAVLSFVLTDDYAQKGDDDPMSRSAFGFRESEIDAARRAIT